MDRGLLLSFMALQKDFLTRSQFLMAFQAWLVNRSLNLDDIIVQRGFLTKNQLERLSTNLQTMQAKNTAEWKEVVRNNEAIGTVYSDMVILSEKNPAVSQMVAMIGTEIEKNPETGAGESKPSVRIDPHSTPDPHATIDIDSLFDPYATLSDFKKDASE